MGHGVSKVDSALSAVLCGCAATIYENSMATGS